MFGLSQRPVSVLSLFRFSPFSHIKFKKKHSRYCLESETILTDARLYPLEASSLKSQ